MNVKGFIIDDEKIDIVTDEQVDEVRGIAARNATSIEALNAKFTKDGEVKELTDLLNGVVNELTEILDAESEGFVINVRAGEGEVKYYKGNTFVLEATGAKANQTRAKKGKAFRLSKNVADEVQINFSITYDEGKILSTPVVYLAGTETVAAAGKGKDYNKIEVVETATVEGKVTVKYTMTKIIKNLDVKFTLTDPAPETPEVTE